jgi:hypothetical protein
MTSRQTLNANSIAPLLTSGAMAIVVKQ